jgi:carboxyl-terminal processing protease
MPFRRVLKILLTVIILLEFTSGFSQSAGEKIIQIHQALESKHVAPVGCNNELSNRVFSIFIESTDPGGLIFLESDIDQFGGYKNDIDNQIEKGSTEFLDLVTSRYIERLSQVDSILKTINVLELGFLEKTEINFNKDGEILYSQTLPELKIEWTKSIKYDMLQLMYSTFPNISFNEDSIKKVIDFVGPKVQAENDCWLFSYGLGDEKYIKDMMTYEFLDAIAKSYDPHSSYFTEDIKEEFDVSLSKEAKSYGITFIKEDGVFKVDGMNPGSSAYQSNLINIGDVVYSITSDGEEIELNCIDEYDLESQLLSNSLSSLVITLVKKSGEKIEVELTKSVLETEDNLLTAYILEGEKKIGYIIIPSFYTNWEGQSMIGCANDVAKEILKLNRENIDGLIIDLRFNGGGSIKEAIDLAGIFIDLGSLGIMTGFTDKPVLLKDFNRGRVYTGPLVVMINGASASASEMFAGALQSHNRALIVGSPSYGKSTGQIVLPIDTNSWSKNNFDESIHFVKVTTSKIYNVNNGSHQAIGVVPDVIIPDIWEPFIPNESDENYYIPNDSIVKKVYFKPYPSMPINVLANSSQKRVKTDSIFLVINHVIDSLDHKNLYSHNVPLEINDFWEYRQRKEDFYEYVMGISKNFSASITPKHLNYYADLVNMDDRFKKRGEKIFKKINNDVMLNEAFNIMVDLIEIK